MTLKMQSAVQLIRIFQYIVLPLDKNLMIRQNCALISYKLGQVTN